MRTKTSPGLSTIGRTIAVGVLLSAGTAAAALPDIFELENASASFFGEQEFDQSGYRVFGAGDVNGDHTDDLLIAAPGAMSGAGKVHVIFGRTVGLSPLTDLSLADASFVGEFAGDQAGIGLCGLGDFNLDGLADIAIGAPFFAHDGVTTGKVYIFLGRTSGWKRGISLADADISIVGEVSMALTGFSLAQLGDVNGDGYSDMGIGAHGMSSMAGRVYVVLGGPKGQFSRDMDISVFPAFIGEAPNDFAGFSVAGVGDTNDDGFADFLIGAYGNSQAGTKAGKVYQIFGHDGAWTSDVPLSQVESYFLGQEPNDFAGYSVAGAGDLDRDGFADFAIGAPGRDINGGGAGMAAIVYGAPGNGGKYGLDQIGVKLFGEAAGDCAGASVSSAGDIDGDGHSDLLVSAHYSDITDVDAGAAYVVRGGPRQTSDQNLDFNSMLFLGEMALDQAGWSVAGAGDVDSDGFADLLIAAYGSDRNGAASGMTYLILTGPYVDMDRDGYSEAMGDCNDFSASQSPGLEEIPNNGIDDDCQYGDSSVFRYIRQRIQSNR